ncbi:hypothetical protein, partial [Kingella kingae]|uniref:hypothetical protein n=1 Tax=Kingella kingae TaxID=504 RepID=UPI001E34098F
QRGTNLNLIYYNTPYGILVVIALNQVKYKAVETLLTISIKKSSVTNKKYKGILVVVCLF